MREQWARGGPCPPRGFQTIKWGGYSENIHARLKSYSKRTGWAEIEEEAESRRGSCEEEEAESQRGSREEKKVES